MPDLPDLPDLPVERYAPDWISACPVCGAPDATVVEDVTGDVVVVACPRCTTTWAVRTDDDQDPQ